MTGRRRRDAGFTLVEVLVATTLVALLTTLVFWGIRFGIQSWAAVNARTDTTANTSAVRDLLSRMIGQAYPAFLTATLTDRRVVFDGTATTLSLIAPLPDAIEAGVMALQRVFVADDHGRSSLYLAWRLDLPPADGSGALAESQTKILDGVRSIRLAYFGPTTLRDPPQWVDRWSGRATLPQLVKVHIEPADPRTPAWPDVLVQPKSTTNTACVYDPADATCRRIR